MAIFLMGGGQVTPIKEHRGSVAVKTNCYRGLYNGDEHADMPPRMSFSEAEADMTAFCAGRRDAEGGMCSYSLPVNTPLAVLPGTDGAGGPEQPHTPDCPDALFARGDVVKLRKIKALRDFPAEAIVAATVPPGFPAEFAFADMLGERRPLEISRPLKVISYILVKEGNPGAFHVRESYLLASGREPVDLGSIKRGEAA
jgi:hypothetical protein